MYELLNFEGNYIDVVEIDGQPLFLAKHVGACLQMSQPTVHGHLKELDEDERFLLTNSNIGLTDIRPLANRGETFITESGVYALIMKSRKPEAQRFQKWVTKEVLPSIRKTGGYQLPKTREQIMAEGLVAANECIAEQNVIIEQQQEQIEHLEPLAEKYGIFMDSKGAIGVNEFCKNTGLSVGSKGLYALMREDKIMMKKSGINIPYQTYMNRGYFRVVQSAPKANGYSYPVTLITKKGADWLVKKCKEWGLLEEKGMVLYA